MEISKYQDAQGRTQTQYIARTAPHTLLLETPKLAAVARRILKAVVTNIGHVHIRIVTGMDRLFQGF